MTNPRGELPPPNGLAGTNNSRTPMTVAAFATERIRDAILIGELAPGQRLPQHALAAQLGVSHVPLREAFQRLESEGFVTIEPRRGAFVVPLTAPDAAEIFQLRSELEAAALRASVPNLSAEQVQVATHICQRANTVTDKTTYGELNWQFHRALYTACQRPRTLGLIEALWRNTNRYSMLLRHRDPDFRRSQREHRAILQAAARRDASGAGELLEAHIGAAAARILKLL